MMRLTGLLLLAVLPLNGAVLKTLRLEPPVAYIHGAGNAHTLLVTAIYDDGSERDVSAQAKLVADVADVVHSTGPAVFQAQREGIVKLRASFEGQSAEGVIVVQPKRSLKMDFALDVAPIFSKMGCNNTNCHGSIKGQKGFKLSLFGYDPDADYRAVVEESGGRRIDRTTPEKSLLLLKPTFTVPHGGGQVLSADAANHEYSTLLNWIKSGLPKSSSSSPRLVSMDVFPHGFRVLNREDERQRIVVVGRYSDGSQEDISQKVRYTSQNDSIEVSNSGEIKPKSNGQVTILIRSLGQVAAVQVGVALGPKVANNSMKPVNFIDELVLDKLARMRIEPSGPATDAEFVRRVYLDTIGILPEVDEAKRFLEDRSPDKRARLIDSLLERKDFGDFWANKWGDLFASNVFTVVDGTSYLQDWLRQAFNTNKPYDKFVKEVLTATGSSWDIGAVNYSVRPAEDLVTLTAQAFLGVSIECARCHDHPSERWKREDFIGLTAFFSQVRAKGRRPPPVELITYLALDAEYRHPETKQVVRPKFIDGTEPILRPLTDRRAVLADWITSPSNPWFAKATVNRFWRQLMEKGLVEPADDFRATNPASNPELLDRLAADFVDHGYDIRHLFRQILNSATYQLSSVPNASNKDDDLHYSHYYLRRLTAEQMMDGLVEITAVPEKFLAYYPGVRSVNLADSGIPSSFLDMYDRPKRDAAKCERSESVSLRQAMNMIAGDTVNKKVRSDASRLAGMVRDGKADQDIIENLYLATLSRYPTAAERDLCLAAAKRANDRSRGLQNVLWALLNSNEFVYNH
jgi:hypothetical protein